MKFLNKSSLLTFLCLFLSFQIYGSNRVSLGTYEHFNPKPNHQGNRVILSYDYFYSNSNFYGLALFNNSFDQFSQYIYKGHTYKSRFTNIHYELSYGIIHGYKGKYQDRIPINTEEGFGIGVIPSIYYDNKGNLFGLSLMGGAGLIFSYSKKI